MGGGGFAGGGGFHGGGGGFHGWGQLRRKWFPWRQRHRRFHGGGMAGGFHNGGGFHGGGFGGGEFHGRGFQGRDFGRRFAFGPDLGYGFYDPDYYDDHSDGYGYPYVHYPHASSDSYADNGSCDVVQRRVHTTHGWRRQPVQVCR
jgi:hypothetical protein